MALKLLPILRPACVGVGEEKGLDTCTCKRELGTALLVGILPEKVDLLPEPFILASPLTVQEG